MVLVVGWLAWGQAAAAQDLDRCAPADRFLTEQLAMVTRLDPDTLDDWRTHQSLAACRVTAAAARTTTLRLAARMFYDVLRDAGWSRTPNPHDSPNESSLRMRLDETDCLFNVYQGILLGTESEIEVTNAVADQLRPDEEFYNVLVICMPAMEVPLLGREPPPSRPAPDRLAVTSRPWPPS